MSFFFNVSQEEAFRLVMNHFTERQMKIVEWIIKQGQITNREVREMFSLSNRVALDEILKLIELKVIKQVGKGRSVHYVLD